MSWLSTLRSNKIGGERMWEKKRDRLKQRKQKENWTNAEECRCKKIGVRIMRRWFVMIVSPCLSWIQNYFTAIASRTFLSRVFSGLSDAQTFSATTGPRWSRLEIRDAVPINIKSEEKYTKKKKKLKRYKEIKKSDREKNRNKNKKKKKQKQQQKEKEVEETNQKREKGKWTESKNQEYRKLKKGWNYVDR